MRRARLGIALTLSGLALAACGGATLSPHLRPETAQPPAPLPAGWQRRLDFTSGVSLGVPPGWRAQRRVDSLLVTSPDRLVAISISADRTGSVLRVPLDRLAPAALHALGGYRDPLQPGKGAPFPGTPLAGASAVATGVSTTGVRQRVQLIVLRRDYIVTYTLVVAANAAGTPPPEIAEALAIARTVRDLPIGGNGGAFGRR